MDNREGSRIMATTPRTIHALPSSTRLTFTFGSLKADTGIHRTVAYELIGLGLLSAMKSGRRTLICARSVERYLAQLPPATIKAPSKRAACPKQPA
jgi:hypothetical protein